jgi:hypothetical protein
MVVRTDAFTLLSMLIRTVLIWVVAGVAVKLPALLIAMRANGYMDDESRIYAVVGAAVTTALLSLSWLFADKIARLTLVRPRDQVFESDLEPGVWLGIAISVIGAWYLFGGLKDLAYLLPRWLIYSRAPGPIPGHALQEIVPELFAVAFELVLAAVFLLRGQGLARWVQRMRYGEIGTQGD